MKKLLMVAMLAGSLVASESELVVGAELGYGNVSSDVSGMVNDVPFSHDVDTYTKSAKLKAGYQANYGRLLGYISTDSFSKSVTGQDEGNANAIGVEVDLFVTDSIYIGGLVGVGVKEFDGSNNNFIEYGLRVGNVFDITEGVNLDVGLQYKVQDYESKSGGNSATYCEKDCVITPEQLIPVNNREIKDQTIMVYVGINFYGL